MPIPTQWISMVTDTFSYTTTGNVAASRTRGTFGYDAVRPNLLRTVTGGDDAGTRSYSYDAVGNQTGRPGEISVGYNDFGQPASLGVSRAGDVAAMLAYPDGQRARKTSNSGATTYVPGLYERQRTGSRTEHRFLVTAGGRTVAAVGFTESGTAPPVAGPISYLHGDRLGSTTLITADGGAGTKVIRATVVEELSYDAFGAPRRADWADPSEDLPTPTVDIDLPGTTTTGNSVWWRWGPGPTTRPSAGFSARHPGHPVGRGARLEPLRLRLQQPADQHRPQRSRGMC